MEVLELLMHRKKNTVLITKLVRKKYGTLEGLFAHGRLYQYTSEEMLEFGVDIIESIVKDAQLDFISDKSEFELLTIKQIKEHKRVSIVVHQDEIELSPYGQTDRYGGAMGKYITRFKLPANNESFRKIFEVVIRDAD